MFTRVIRSTSIRSLIFLLIAVCSVPVHAAIAPAGEVILTSGPFIAIQPDSSARSLAGGSEFYEGDRLWTGPSTRAQIRFSDGAIMTLRPDTEFSVDEYEFDEKTTSENKSLLTLVKGGFRTITGLISRLRPSAYTVKTSYAIIGVRGTMYETVVDRGLYVAAWQGTVSVANDKGEILLGFGQDYSFASVASATSAPTGKLLTPPPLQQSVDPDLQGGVLDTTENRLVASVQDPIAGIVPPPPPRLTPAQLASLDRFGFAAFSASSGTTPLAGASSDGAGGSPIFFDPSADVVLRQGSAPGVVSFTDPRFPVSFGTWDATASTPAAIQPDANDGSVVLDVTNPVHWITLAPPTTLPAGSVSFFSAGSALTGLGSGSDGPSIILNRFQTDVDFGTGALTNGQMQVENGANIWDAEFSGMFSAGTFSAALDAGSTVNDGTTSNAAQGSVEGSFTEDAAGILGIGGVFDFEQVGLPTTYVEGVFLAQEDRRFAPGELASLDQVGIAVFDDGPGGPGTFIGEASDGAGGSPIIFDIAGDEILRQDAAPLAGAVVPDITLGAAFPVSWGEWNASLTNPGLIQTDPNDGAVGTAVTDTVFWITAIATPSVPATGTVSYTNVVGFQGNGDGGAVLFIPTMGITVDFGTAAVNGNMIVQNGAPVDNWNVNFAGSLSGASVNATLDPATSAFSDNGGPFVSGVTGSIDGTLTGAAAEGIAGAFDFEFGATNNVEGTFFVTQ